MYGNKLSVCTTDCYYLKREHVFASRDTTPFVARDTTHGWVVDGTLVLTHARERS